MAYYEDTKTNDELWTVFTDFSSYVEYKKIKNLFSKNLFAFGIF